MNTANTIHSEKDITPELLDRLIAMNKGVPFVPESATHEQRFFIAEAHVARLDALDGWKDRDIKTIWSALSCGLKNPSTNAHYEALVMLEEIAKSKH